MQSNLNNQCFQLQKDLVKSADFFISKIKQIKVSQNDKNPEIVLEQTFYKKIITKKDQKIQSLSKKVKDLSNQVVLYKNLLQSKETQSKFFKVKIKEELQKNRLIEDQLAYMNLKLRKLTQNLKSSRKNQTISKQQQELRKSQLRSLGKQLISQNRRFIQVLTYQIDKVIQVYKKAHNLKEKMKENKNQNQIKNINDQRVQQNLKQSQNLHESLKTSSNQQLYEVLRHKQVHLSQRIRSD